MTTVHVQAIGDKAVLPRAELERIVKLAELSEPITLLFDEEDLPTVGIAWLADQGGAFDFWRDEAEAIYSPEDGEPL